MEADGLLHHCSTWGVKTHYIRGSASTNHMTLPREGGATYGFVVSGTMQVEDTTSKVQWTLHAGQYWTTPNGCTVRPSWNGPSRLSQTADSDGENGEEGGAFIVQKSGFASLHTAGGPAERKGRLRYIDGCSDSVLLPPPVLGDPCLNLLHFPPGVRQSAHTHPSVRAGVIASGRGFCLLHTGSQPVSLEPGTVFIIPADVLHSFETLPDSEMRVVAFHPDSDCGPTHENHPMINKTILPVRI